MRTMKTNPNPIDHRSILQSQEILVLRKNVVEREEDEDFTVCPVPAPTFRTSLIKISRSVSEKLFSIEFGKISF